MVHGDINISGYGVPSNNFSYCSHVTIPRGVSACFLRKSRGLQRQNVVKQHFVCIAKRVTGHGVNSNQFYNC